MSARITVVGNVASAPTTRRTASGRVVTNFRVGSTERRQDRRSGEWVDGNQFFVGVASWGALGENVAESVRIGMPVVVTGRISQRAWTDENQQTRFNYEIQADTVSPDLSRGTAHFQKVSRSTGPSIALDDDGQPVVVRSDTDFAVVEEHRGGPDGEARPEPSEDDDDEHAAPGRAEAELAGLVGALG